MSSNNKTYMSNGEVLSSPPLPVRISRFFENIYFFLGLYFVTLFSLDPYAAAQSSQFNVSQAANRHGARSRWGGGGGSSSGGAGGGGGGPGGFGPRRIGRVDDVRGPECKSCR